MHPNRKEEKSTRDRGYLLNERRKSKSVYYVGSLFTNLKLDRSLFTKQQRGGFWKKTRKLKIDRNSSLFTK